MVQQQFTKGLFTVAVVTSNGHASIPSRLTCNPPRGSDLRTVWRRMAILRRDALWLQGEDLGLPRRDDDGRDRLRHIRHLSMGVGALGTARTMNLLRRNICRAVHGDQPLVREDTPRPHGPRPFQGGIHLGTHRKPLSRGHGIEPRPDLMLTGNSAHPQETRGVAPPVGVLHRPLIGQK